MLLEVLIHPVRWAILSQRQHRRRTVQVRLSIHPITIDVVLNRLLEEIVEVMFGEKVLPHRNEVMIDLVNVLHATLVHDVLRVLSFELDMWDVLAVWCVILGLLFILKGLRLEDIETVDFTFLALRFLHTNLVNFATELAALLRDHTVKITGHEDLPVVSVAKLVNSEGNLGIRG